MSDNEWRLTSLKGMDVYLPDGRRLGAVHDAVVEAGDHIATHLFVKETPEDLVEGEVNLAVPWRWVRSVGDVVLLRWFPKTPIPLRN
jgi:sporulation protein YlmC with PRC-barrel domain